MAKRRKKVETNEEEQVEQQVVPTVEATETKEETPTVEVTPIPEVKEKVVVPKEEPKVVTPEPKQEVKEKPKVETIKAKATFETIYEDGMKDPVVSSIADALKHYVDVCYIQNSQDGATVASMNYNLFNLIIGALNDADRASSTKKMNFINKVFLVEKDRYFNVISLSRYDHFWSFGPESKMGYSMLIKFISDLSNPNTRKAKAKVLSADKMAKFLPEGIVGKLESFYKL